jgi:hypothetical protein
LFWVLPTGCSWGSFELYATRDDDVYSGILKFATPELCLESLKIGTRRVHVSAKNLIHILYFLERN